VSKRPKDGGPVYPQPAVQVRTAGGLEWTDSRNGPGMSLRDWLAGQAMAAILSCPEAMLEASHRTEVTGGNPMEPGPLIASHSYRMADAMLARREREATPAAEPPAVAHDWAAQVPGRMVLCDDRDLMDEYERLSSLPGDVFAADGMARWCAVASRKTWLLVSQLYPEELGYDAKYSRLADPSELSDAAVHWALTLAFDACHEQTCESFYLALRDYHDDKRKEAIADWQLTFNVEEPQS